MKKASTKNLSVVEQNLDPFSGLPFADKLQALGEISQSQSFSSFGCSPAGLLAYTLIKWHQPQLLLLLGQSDDGAELALMALEALHDGFLQFGSKGLELVQTDYASATRPVSVMSVASVNQIAADSDERVIEYLKTQYSNFRHYQMTPREFLGEVDELVDFDFRTRRLMAVVSGQSFGLGNLHDLEQLAKLRAELILVDRLNACSESAKLCKAFARQWGYEWLSLPQHHGMGFLVREHLPKPIQENRAPIFPMHTSMAYHLGGLSGIKLLNNFLKRFAKK